MASTARAIMPPPGRSPPAPARPRQPQCSIATPPGPASATGTQSATKTSRAKSTSAVRWPSTSGIGLPGWAKGLGDWGAACACSSPPCTCLPTAIRSGAKPSAAASRWRFSITDPVSSSVRTPRLRRSKGGPLTPPMRVVKAAVAPDRPACSQRTPSASRHSIVASSRRECRLQLGLAALDLAVELAPQGLPQAAADGRSLGHAGGDQIAPVDRQLDLSPLAHILVEPLGPQRASDQQVDRAESLGQGDGLRRGLGVALG